MFSLNRLKRIAFVMGTLVTFGFSVCLANPVENVKENVPQIVKTDIVKTTVKESVKDTSINTNVSKETSNASISKDIVKNEVLQLKPDETSKVQPTEVNLVYKNGNNTLPNYKDFTQTAVKTTSAAETAQKEMDKHHHSVLQNVLPAALAVGAVYVGQHNWGDLQNKVGVDRVAHFACSYIINDQLQRTCKMSPFMATLTTIAIGAAKEKWVDNKWNNGDFAADCAGAIFADIKF